MKPRKKTAISRKGEANSAIRAKASAPRQEPGNQAREAARLRD